MTALAASLLITLYLLIPSSLFRLFFGFFVPLRSFVRTRGEELFQAVASVFLPICLTAILVWTVSPFNQLPLSFIDTTQARSADYKLIASALYSEAIFKEKGDAFWNALNRTERRQGRFLIWYYLFVVIEGVLVGGLCISYPKLAGRRWYEVAAKHVLLPNISAWHLLLTPFFSSCCPIAPNTARTRGGSESATLSKRSKRRRSASKASVLRIVSSGDNSLDLPACRRKSRIAASV